MTKIKNTFKINFNFSDWKKMSMPDFYRLDFNENQEAINFIRDIKHIDNLFYIK